MNRNGDNRGNGNRRRPFDFDNAPPPPADTGKIGGMKMFSIPLGSVSTMQTGRGQQQADDNGASNGQKGHGAVARSKQQPAQSRRPAAGKAAATGVRPRSRTTGNTAQTGRQTGARTNPANRGNLQNPQSAGYRQGTPRPRRRLTKTEKNRIKRNRFIAGMALIVCVLVLGVALSVNLLFKVTEIRVENQDKSTPANTGIYSEQQVIDLLGVQMGDNLFGFSTGRRAKALAKALPYLDTVEVHVRLPGTVIVRIQSATERFAIPWNGQWLTLSDGLKVLSVAQDCPDGLIWLDAVAGTGMDASVGSYLTIEAPNTATEETLGISTAEAGAMDATETLKQLLAALEKYNFLDGTTLITMQDLSQISFLYDGRISVQLGTINNLDYKMRLASNAVFDTEGKGLSSSDRGTLDVSYQRTDGEIYGYFNPAEAAPAPTEPPVEEPSEENQDEDNQTQEGESEAASQ